MKHTPIKINKITDKKYEAEFKLLMDDVCTKIDVTVIGETIEEVIKKTEEFLGEKVEYEIV